MDMNFCYNSDVVDHEWWKVEEMVQDLIVDFLHVLVTNSQLGLSKDLPDSTHSLPTELNPPPSKPTALVVDNGFHSPKTEISGSDIGSPPLKSKKLDPIDPSIFPVRKCRSNICWDFFRKTQLRSCRKRPRSHWIWRDLAGFQPFSNFCCRISTVFHLFLAGFSSFSR